MPLANIFLLCALAFPGVRSIGVFFQESQPQETRPKPDQAQEAPKPAEPEPSKPEQSTSPPAAAPDSRTQSPPPTTNEKPQAPAAEPGATKPSEATSPADKEPSGEKKAAEPARKCHGPGSDKASSGPKARVVRRGSTTEPTIQFVPGLAPGQAAAQRQSTTQLLVSTEANLKKISSQQLTPPQRESVSQIRKYMEQAKTADGSGDVQRAHNLAFKARLLSDELLRR
jgi:cytoskeletal protein RodZ